MRAPDGQTSCHVLGRRQSEHAGVLAAELCGTLITDFHAHRQVRLPHWRSVHGDDPSSHYLARNRYNVVLSKKGDVWVIEQMTVGNCLAHPRPARARIGLMQDCLAAAKGLGWIALGNAE